MNDFSVGLIAGAVVMWVIMLIGGLVVIDSVKSSERNKHQKQAIENGCAYYSPMTGEFEWGRIK